VYGCTDKGHRLSTRLVDSVVSTFGVSHIRTMLEHPFQLNSKHPSTQTQSQTMEPKHSPRRRVRCLSLGSKRDPRELESSHDSFLEESEHKTRSFDTATSTAFQQVKILAATETANANMWKVILLFLWVVGATGVATGSYVLLSGEEQANYRDAVSQLRLYNVDSPGQLWCLTACAILFCQYHRFAETIENAMKMHLQNIDGGMQRMEAVVAAEGYRHNTSLWPFVTVPGFEVLGASVREQTGFEVIVFCPLVVSDKVDEWLQFSSTNAPLWFAESLEASLSERKASRAGGDLNTTDYAFAGVPSTLLDLPAAIGDATEGKDLAFVPSEVNSPFGPFFPVWYDS
jgi:hypothetical protein